MAASRGYGPAQFRGLVKGTIGPFTATADLPSVAAGAVGTVAVTVPAGLGLVPGDFLQVIPPVNTAGVAFAAQVVSNTSISLFLLNGTGAAVDAASGVYTFAGFRFKLNG